MVQVRLCYCYFILSRRPESKCFKSVGTACARWTERCLERHNMWLWPLTQVDFCAALLPKCTNRPWKLRTLKYDEDIYQQHFIWLTAVIFYKELDPNMISNCFLSTYRDWTPPERNGQNWKKNFHNVRFRPELHRACCVSSFGFYLVILLSRI